jgi:1,2-diacylglycerol 3-beta-glucosyltransferase
MPLLPIIYSAILFALGIAVLGSTGYLLTLLGAAALARRDIRTVGVDIPPTRFVVLVPAHDEELVLAATLESLNAQDYPRDLYEVVVIADNCTDTTAMIGRMHGVTVWERFSLQERGKGYALDWAMQRLLAGESPADAFVVVDADTWAAPDFLTQAARGLAARTDAQGRCALQGRYGVLNTNDGWRAALMAAAFDLFNHVKPLGRDRLGLSVGLKGNGMIFTHALLTQARWRGDSVTEDIDFGLDLIRDHGVRVGYLPAARVLAQMPATADGAASQRERWEGGRYRLLRTRAIPLLAAGLRQRRWALCDAAFDLMLPPLAELGTLWLFWAGLIIAGAIGHWLPLPLAWIISACTGGAALLAYLLGGLRVSDAPAAAYAALARAPFYAAWKMVLYARRFARPRRAGTPPTEEWVRTARLPLAPESPNASSEGKAA